VGKPGVGSWSVRITLVAFVGTILVAACAGDDDDSTSRRSEHSTTADSSTTTAPTDGTPATTSTTTAGTTATTAPPAPPTTRPATPEGEVAADYLAYWDVYDHLAADPKANAGEVARHASGQARDSLEQAVHGLATQGSRTEFGPLEKHNPYAPSVIDDNTAYVADCHLSDARVVDASGKVIRGDPAGGRPESIAATLVRGDDRWLVDSLDYYDLAPGETCTSAGPGPG
jgi:hypothetical protein